MRCCASWTSTARSCGSSVTAARGDRAGQCRGQAADDDPWGRRDRRSVDRCRGWRLLEVLLPEPAGQLSRVEPKGQPVRGTVRVARGITKQGRARGRGMLVEAPWAACKTPGRLKAFFEPTYPQRRGRGRRQPGARIRSPKGHAARQDKAPDTALRSGVDRAHTTA